MKLQNHPITKLPNFLHHFRSPQIVQVDDAFELAVAVHHRQRRDLLFFHDGDRCGGEFSGGNGFRVPGHALGGGEIKHVFVLKGGMRKKQRRSIAEGLASVPEDEPRVILATGSYIGEGFDDARLDTLFLAMPISWKGTRSATLF